ncbi:choice-of-anchor L domain-containing protein, partial [Flavobacterium gelidilacus]|uniref:choice-of-anchor L domain-containing protein n=2 Tax=Flavobacterium gelidilacus TaxID=206041 RepID=UPI0039EE4AA9
MKKITLLFVMLFFSFISYSQLIEDFEGTTTPNLTTGNWALTSGNWKVFDNGIGTAQSWGVIPAPNSCNGRSAYLNRENVTDGTFAEDWLVTPLSTVPANGQLHFSTKQTLAANFGSVYTIRVSLTSQTNAGSFTTIQTWNETELNAVYDVCEEKVVQFPAAYVGQQVYVAFVMTNDNGDRWIVDDVSIVEQCLDPTVQTATNATLTGATLGWDNPSGASQWEVEIVGTGATPTGTGTLVSSNPYPVTGLTQGTCYDFYVRAKCTSGTNSQWVGPFNFCTVSLGETCGAPIVVPDLATGPYSTTDNTSGYGDDYSGSPGSSGCGTTGTYLNGDDVFYQFTATSTNSVTITSQTNSTWSGLFVYNSCANIGVSCVAGNTAGNGSTAPDTVTFTPTIGETYYIVISTWAAPQSVPYTLDIFENTCTNLTATYAMVSNCSSGTDTFFVTANVTNLGTATSVSGTTTPASTTETLSAAGTMQFGPFPNNTPVIINLQNDQDVNCFRNSTALTQTFCPAPNNLCANAIPVTCGSTFAGTTQGSTSVGASAAFCGTASNTSPGVWYSFAGNGDIVTFSLCGSAFNTKIQVLTGSCGTFTCVAGNDNSCGLQSEIQVTTTPGTLYYIYVFGVNNTTVGTFTLNTTCITPPPPPTNDNCVTAITVPVNIDGSCSQITAGTVVGATPSSQANGCIGSADDDVWFSFTATQGIHTISLQNIAGSTLDLNHVIYTSTNTTNPCGNLTQVFCSNPDFSYLTGLIPGQVYFIRVYTATAALLQTTTFNVCVSVPPPTPSNDSCATPIIAPVNAANDCALFISGSVTSATASPEPKTCGGTADDDVWFQFTAANSTHIISLNNITGTNTNLNFVVYTGASCGSLTQVACNLPNSGTIAGLTPGTTYLIRVYTDTATIGQFSNFDLCIGSPPITLDNTTYTVPQLVTDVLINSPCAQVTNITWKTGNTNNFGSTNGIAYFQENSPGILPFSNGIVMTTGNAMRVSGPNDSLMGDGNQAWTGDTELETILAASGVTLNSRNASVIEFDFVPLIDQISFNFMFASEEYGTFQCSFSDSFAFILTNTVTNTVSNLAFVPATTTPISVVTVRDNAFNAGCASVNPQYFDVFNGTNPATAATNFQGQTVEFTAQSTVVPLTLYHIKMVIADNGDNSYDSGVFLEANSFNVGNIELGNDFLEANGNALCVGDSYTIVSGLNTANYTFQWSNASGPIAGETGPNLVVTEEGTYSIAAQYTGTTCAAIDSITIEYYDPFTIGASDNLIACNSVGYSSFDLTENTVPILDALNPADYTVTYYTTQSDAENDVNPILAPDSYTNVIQNLEPIFVRIENVTSGCYQTTTFNLVVQDLTPQFTLTNDFSICQNGSGTVQVTPINFVDADVTYTWTLGTVTLPETTNTLSVNQAGTYTVVVDNNGCTATMSCTVSVTPAPVLSPVSNVTACDSYILPALSVGDYFSQTGGVGAIDISVPLTSTQTVYVYAESGTAPSICSTEASFTVTINTIVADSPADVFMCDSYVLPALSANNFYYTAPGGPTGTGVMLNAGDVITTDQVIHIYAQTNTT